MKFSKIMMALVAAMAVTIAPMNVQAEETVRIMPIMAIDSEAETETETETTSIQPILISAQIIETISNQVQGDFEITYLDETIEMDVAPQLVDGKVMVPLRSIAEALGYEVTWNGETGMVELFNGARYTAVTIGSNSYFVNRMAPSPLSSEPVIVEDRTLVPVEFVTDILGYGIVLEEGVMTIMDEPFTTLTGYIMLMEQLDDYYKVYVAPREGDDIELWETTVLIVSDDTIINREPLKIGDFISGVHLPVMTMSIPGQTSAVVIY